MSHPVDPIVPSRTAVLARVVSAFPHWKVEDVPTQTAMAVCSRAPPHPVDPIVFSRTAVLAGVVSVFPH